MAKKSVGSGSQFFLALLTAVMLANASAQADDFMVDAVFAPFAKLLDEHVDGGNVDYDAFAESDDFKRFIKTLGRADLPADATAQTRMAAWINAYNALSILGILDGYSPSSLFGRLRFFKRRQYRVFGSDMTLFELEHERIISEGDPRIHFAIVCSSRSCPPLNSELYLPETLDEQLESATRKFINDAGNNRFDLERKSATLSRIFKWYEDEFAASEGSLADYLAAYVDDEALAQSLRREEWTFDFSTYDWSLNGTFSP